MTFIIRHEESGDICAIEALTAAAFLAEEHSSHTEQFIVNALRHAGALTLSLVAEQDGIPIGHAALSPVTVSDGAPGWYGLAPVSVLPTHQNQGIGSQLIRQLLAETARKRRSRLCGAGQPGLLRPFWFQDTDRTDTTGHSSGVFPGAAIRRRQTTSGHGRLPPCI